MSNVNELNSIEEPIRKQLTHTLRITNPILMVGYNRRFSPLIAN